MISARDLAVEICVTAVRWGIATAEHAHATGVSRLHLSGSVSQSPLQVRKHLLELLDQPLVMDAKESKFLRRLPRNPKDWSAQMSTDRIFYCERVETLAWAGTLIDEMPSPTAATPEAWPFAARVLDAPFARVAEAVRLRKSAALARAHAQTGAWYWRVKAEELKHGMEVNKAIRKYANSVRRLIPVAAKIGESQGWFQSEHSDFPIGRLRLTMSLLSTFEQLEVREVTRGRCSAMRAVMGGPDAESDVEDWQCWDMMIGNDPRRPQHPKRSE